MDEICRLIYYGLDKGKKRDAFRIIAEVERDEYVEMCY